MSEFMIGDLVKGTVVTTIRHMHHNSFAVEARSVAQDVVGYIVMIYNDVLPLEISDAAWDRSAEEAKSHNCAELLILDKKGQKKGKASSRSTKKCAVYLDSIELVEKTMIEELLTHDHPVLRAIGLSRNKLQRVAEGLE